ncbi:MAG: (Fe-S)-binding protein [Candidatus Dormibacteraeota bacterium]|nr:(Fe-S)-binding protein [Candidatus Dormibacteraeota bacterium]MBV9524526.1 (Fe-S)-binding protein [Candidatus Dormibacteraeota bacterium]
MALAAELNPRFLADVYQAASECNKCSLCQATCPAYVTNPVEWETARGRVSLIRDAIEGRLELRDIADGPLSTCLTCDNCVAACAPRVPTGHIVSRARQELHEQEGHPWKQSFALRNILPHPGALRFVHGLARFTQVTGLYALARRGGLLQLFGGLGRLADYAGPLERRTAYQRARSLPAVTPPVRGRVGFLVCCYENLAAPQSTEAAMRVLLANGYDVTVPVIGCSGLPARTLGDRDAMVDMAVRNSDALRGLDVDAYVGDVASCVGHFHEYGAIAGDDRLVGDAARDVALRTALTSDFLDRNGIRAELGPLRWNVVVDEPCSLPVDGPRRGAMRRLLSQVPRLRVLDLHEAAMCCGGAGTYFARMPERSEAILERKFDNIRASGAEVVVTENISCLVQLRAGAARHAPGVRVMHVMELLDESMTVAQRRRAVIPE